MKPHVTRTLHLIKQNHKGDVPTREEIKRRIERMRLSNGSFARLADISEGTMTSLNQGRPLSDAMLVYMRDVLDSTVWDEHKQTYGRICNGFLIQVGKSERLGNGWSRTGQFLPRKVTNLGTGRRRRKTAAREAAGAA